MYESQVAKLEGAIMTLESQIMTLESATVNKATFEAMVSGNQAFNHYTAQMYAML